MAIEDFQSANLATMKVWATDREKLAEDKREQFDKVVTSPIAPEAASHFVEFVFANKTKFSKASKEMAAEVADFVTGHRFYGFGENQRGNKISKILRGETVQDVPVVLPQFADKPEAPVAVPALPAE